MAAPTYKGYEELADISLQEVERYTRASLPLIIPWHPNETIPLGTLFFSSRPKSPWAKSSPFDERSLALNPMTVSRDYGTQSVFRSQSTSRSTQTKDHLELGLGVGVGLPFLASVTVKGTYCKDVQENNDSNKTSVNFSTRGGSVSFEKQPRLTTEAIITIKYGGGLQAFQERYGDYYLAAYRLGGETGILVSGDSSSKLSLERFGITVTVEVLFAKASTTHTQDFSEIEAHNGLKIVGYDTLGHTKYNSAARDHAVMQSEVETQAGEYCDKARSLDLRVAEKLNEMDISDGDYVDSTTCQRLVESGLVVELMLLPVITLREVQSWVIESDVI